MIIYYDTKYRAPIIAKVIQISRSKQVDVDKKKRDSISGTTDTDYYVSVHGEQDYCIRISWNTSNNYHDFGFIKFNYKCPDMAPLPDMPTMTYGDWLDDTTPAIGIDSGDLRVNELVRVLEYKSIKTKINRIGRACFQNLLGIGTKR